MKTKTSGRRTSTPFAHRWWPTHSMCFHSADFHPACLTSDLPIRSVPPGVVHAETVRSVGIYDRTGQSVR